MSLKSGAIQMQRLFSQSREPSRVLFADGLPYVFCLDLYNLPQHPIWFHISLNSASAYLVSFIINWWLCCKFTRAVLALRKLTWMVRSFCLNHYRELYIWKSFSTFINWNENTVTLIIDDLTQKIEICNCRFWILPMRNEKSTFIYFSSLKQTCVVPDWRSKWELLAYSYTSWPSWLPPWDYFCSALFWHFDRRLTLPFVTSKVFIVIRNLWSLDISGGMLQISHYTGACDEAETADPKALYL